MKETKETNVLTATIKEGTLYIYKLALHILLLHILQIFFLLFVFLKLCLSYQPPSVSCPFSQPPLIYLQNPGGAGPPQNQSGGRAAPMAPPLATPLPRGRGVGVRGGTHGQIFKHVLCTYLTPSPTNRTLYLSRAVQIRLRTILSFIQSYKI